jgi:RES domain-containing protein
MIIFRLAKAKYSYDISGNGAFKTGGRWNSKGIAMVYTSDSRALCTAEIAIHTPLGLLPVDYKIITIEIPDSIIIKTLAKSKLPSDWNSIPHSGSTQEIGDKFIKLNKSAVLKVPSAVVQGDFNYLLNPKHSDFKKVKIRKVEPFVFDSRLFVQ